MNLIESWNLVYIIHITLPLIEVRGLIRNSAYTDRKKRDRLKFYWMNFLSFISHQLKSEEFILY